MPPLPDAPDDRITLLIVDDDRPHREALAAAFARRGYDVRAAASAPEALQLCAAGFAPERAVVDLRMDGGSGLDLLRELKRLDPATAVVVLTGYGSIATAVEAMRRGATHYLAKPAEPAEIDAAFAGTRPAPEVTVPSLERAEWEHIQRVLADCDGSISEAARRLGMHRRSLQRKLQKYPPRR